MRRRQTHLRRRHLLRLCTPGASAAATLRLIGPPGMFVVESYRKKMLCRMSEDLAKLDPALRYALPCAFSGPRDEQGAAHEALLRTQAGS